MSTAVNPSASEQEYIPGTAVIKNLIDRDEQHPFGTSDARYLEQAETLHVSRRIAELRATPITGTFTFGHMRQIHQHLFQDVYAWAGDPRNVPMQKLSTSYAGPAEMPGLLRQQYASLAAQDHLRGITDRAEFTQKLAGFWGEINHGHAFREGNTRSQTVFFSQLVEQAGWKLDVARLSPRHASSVYQEFVDARFEHQRVRGLSSQESGTGALSAPEAALELANVLGQLIEPDSSPEGGLRRGVAHIPAEPAVHHARTALLARNPELRDMTLDPYGLLSEEGEQGSSLNSSTSTSTSTATSTERGYEP